MVALQHGVELKMKNYNKFVLVTFIALILSACATGPPTQEEFAKADYGRVVTQDEAQPLAEIFLSKRLKDSYSAQYEWGNVYKSWIRHAPAHGGGLVFGYILDVKVNAKNSFGGYVGFKPYRFVYKNGDIVTVYGQKSLDGGASYMAKLY